jgi:alkaline phosphatase
MKCVKRFTTIALSFVFCVFLMGAPVMAKDVKNTEGPGKAKNVIFMVPDGQGLSNVTAARIFKNGPDGPPLFQETLENIGYQRTHSANSTVTDSAAAASAWAVGEKFKNGEISCHSDGAGGCKKLKPTILEIAAEMGKATGLVASSQISHATPASFGAHVPNRLQGFEIARQYIEDVGIDVVLGGGVYQADIEQRQTIIDLAIAKGYTFAQNETQMDSAAVAGAKVLGLFEQNGIGKGKTPEMFWVDGSDYPKGEPTLAEMTSAALDILENDKDGLFLLVEGSQIDWANHVRNIPFQIAESLAFDESVKVVLEWMNAKAERKKDTLIIITADHDCAGFGINGPYGTLSGIGDVVEGSFTGGGHTAVDTIIYSQGPGSEKLNAAVDNTDLYYVMEQAFR